MAPHAHTPDTCSADENGKRCPCRRFIKPTKPTSGKQLCRDCGHIEGAHPEITVAPIPSSESQRVLDSLRPAVNILRLGEDTTAEEARVEALANYRPGSTKASGSSSKASSSKTVGRSSGGKLTTSKAKTGGNAETSGPKDKWINVGQVVLFPEGLEEYTQELESGVNTFGVSFSHRVPQNEYRKALRNARLIVHWDDPGMADLLRFKASWSMDAINEHFLRKVFPEVFGFLEREFSNRVEPGDALWALMNTQVGTRGKVFLYEKEIVTGESLNEAKNPASRGWKGQTLFFVLRLSIPDYIWSKNDPKDVDWSASVQVDDATSVTASSARTVTKKVAQPAVKGLSSDTTGGSLTENGGNGEGKKRAIAGVKVAGRRRKNSKVKPDVKGKGKAKAVESESESSWVGESAATDEMDDEGDEDDEGDDEDDGDDDNKGKTGMTSVIDLRNAKDSDEEDNDDVIFPPRLTTTRSKARRVPAESDDDVQIVEGPSSLTTPAQASPPSASVAAASGTSNPGIAGPTSLPSLAGTASNTITTSGPLLTTSVLQLPNGAMTQMPSYYNPSLGVSSSTTTPSSSSTATPSSSTTTPSSSTATSTSSIATPSSSTPSSYGTVLGRRPTSTRPKTKYGFPDLGKPSKNPWKKPASREDDDAEE
ncbi:uncharacterized protein STEHIDRAFT_151317 [Stereum hirsutum FP-91666 SS1]|uniref:uncharacterized protein n=1 Tax=Stereum hirsutum (strain FP-91666) TaxID=721885 RepID=UPI000440D624|nr:uncharacterized protein STEHIDRAFT_151317 [Stereum hirsutum FP-91666 SS1]EIM91963.1 hypothetical protein STEHIDRAFT_151317 [Stereum hirsutum FP-91666 SS1]